MKKTLRMIFAIGLSCACLFTGCADSTLASDEADGGQDNGIEIGMCFDSFVIERWQRDRDVFV
ncbi:MAG: LacI family transcriptional regulator, partial [Pseudobutyrivibrio sp.]|nr:LacI family transcriptional regulator [Pseudobutyrivibrio sp.]MCF0187527.1 LacI family transcriptional regulator [Bacteroidaceae bacterium]